MQKARETLIPVLEYVIKIRVACIPHTPTKDGRNSNGTDLAGMNTTIGHFLMALTIAHGIALAAFEASSLI
jgi:hypothetical protein